MIDSLAVGHFALDYIFLPNRSTPFVCLGGSVAYVSRTIRCLGATASVVSKVGEDFPEAYLWWLQQEHIDVSGIVKAAGAKTTSFELSYNDDLTSRSLKLKGRAPPIVADELPDSLRVKTAHLAPIAGEISHEIAEKLRHQADVLSLDPQGLLRTFDANGNVTYESLKDNRILELINIYKSSLDEIKIITCQSELDSAIKTIHDYGVKTVIVTLGTEGAAVSIDNTVYRVSACKPRTFVDPTGAGDVFIGGFLAEHIQNSDCLWCACVGSAAASINIEAVGLTFSTDKPEIYRRARLLYEKEIKE